MSVVSSEVHCDGLFLDGIQAAAVFGDDDNHDDQETDDQLQSKTNSRNHCKLSSTQKAFLGVTSTFTASGQDLDLSLDISLSMYQMSLKYLQVSLQFMSPSPLSVDIRAPGRPPGVARGPLPLRLPPAPPKRPPQGRDEGPGGRRRHGARKSGSGGRRG